MMLRTALMMLRANPLQFLRNHLLTLAGHPQSGQRLMYFGYDSKGLGQYFEHEGFKICPTPVALDHTQMGLTHQTSMGLQVHNVRMIPRAENLDIAAIEPYVLDGNGPDLMITGQLSACLFAIRREFAPNRLIVAHVQPGGHGGGGLQRGHTLHQSVRIAGQFHGYGRVTHVFGANQYAYAFVVGIRTAGTWHVYAQRLAGPQGPLLPPMQIV